MKVAKPTPFPRKRARGSLGKCTFGGNGVGFANSVNDCLHNVRITIE